MMYEAEYVETGDPTPLVDRSWQQRWAAATQQEVTDTTPRLSFDEALRQFLALNQPQRQDGEARSGDDNAAIGSSRGQGPHPQAVAVTSLTPLPLSREKGTNR